MPIGCSRQCVLIWLYGIVEFYCAQRFLIIDEQSCVLQQQPFKMELTPDKDTGNITLQYSNTSDISKPKECYVEVKYIYVPMYTTIMVDVSMVSEKSCLYHLDMFTGNPSGNRAITTLDCESKRHWKGHWPMSYLYLRYKIRPGAINEDHNTNSLISVIRFSKCRRCYKMPSGYYNKVHLSQSVKESVCVDDSYINYESNRYSYFGFCGHVTFHVRGNVPLCFSVYSDLHYGSKTDSCQTIIKIDGQQVMDNDRNIYKSWCLPWSIKGQSVSFNIKKNSGENCLCRVQIKTNSSNRHTSCPLITTAMTTTRARYEWSSWSSDVHDVNDDSSESDGITDFKIIGLCVGFIVFGILGCICCKACYKASNEDTAQDNDAERTSSAITARNQPDRSQYQPSYLPQSDAAAEYSYLLPQPPVPNRPRVLNRQPQVSNRQSLNGISEEAPAYDDIQPIDSSSYQRDRDNQPSQTSVQRRVLINNTNDSPNGEPPPPSYEDVCRNPIYYK